MPVIRTHFPNDTDLPTIFQHKQTSQLPRNNLHTALHALLATTAHLGQIKHAQTLGNYNLKPDACRETWDAAHFPKQQSCHKHKLVLHERCCHNCQVCRAERGDGHHRRRRPAYDQWRLFLLLTNVHHYDRTRPDVCMPASAHACDLVTTAQHAIHHGFWAISTLQDTAHCQRPPGFKTQSTPVAMISNTWRSVNDRMHALLVFMTPLLNGSYLFLPQLWAPL